MNPVPSDTSLDVEKMQLQLMREKSPHELVMMAVRLSHEVICACKRAIALAHPELKPRQREYLFIELNYGLELATAVRQRDENTAMTGNCDVNSSSQSMWRHFQ